MMRVVAYSALALLFVAIAAPAQADTIVAPVGGVPISIGRRVVCSAGTDLQGWSAEPDAHHIRPPLKGAAVAPVPVKVAADATQCATNPNTLTAVAIEAWPIIDVPGVVVNVDAGRVDITGQNLRGLVLTWTSQGKTGSDVCHDPQTDPNRPNESCAFTIAHDLPADPALISLLFLPTNVQMGDDVFTYDLNGRSVRPEHYQFAPARVVVTSLLPVDVSMDADADVARLSLKRPEAVSTVECMDATCYIDGDEILVRGEHGTDENLELRMRLRPHVYLQGATSLESFPVAMVPLQRCPLALASAPPLRGIANQNLVLRIGGRCRKDTSLRFFISGSAARLVSTRDEDDVTYAVVHADNVLGDDVLVSMQRGGGVVGVARTHTRLVPTIHARVELPNFGPIDFIPSNRDATVVLPSMGEAGVLSPLPMDDVYTVSRDEKGADHIRGIEGTTGWVALRLAYRDKTLPPALRDTNLAEITDAVDRSIRAASLPIGLGSSAESDQPIVELLCNDGNDVHRRMIPGKPEAVPFSQRDTCRLVLHRELLKAEEGDQALRITASVTGVDGSSRAEGALDQHIVLKPGKDPQYLYITGVQMPFDRVVVRATLLADDARYAVNTEKINAPQVQWSITVGTSKFRIFGTISVPTGLFRVAKGGPSGLLGINAGFLARLVPLTEAGLQVPVGLEAGVMWLGITGDTASAGPLGQAAVVAGLSMSVPIANVSRMAQASISLHAWFEYEVSRALAGEKGNPIGFIFGPSISVGDVGVNF